MTVYPAVVKNLDDIKLPLSEDPPEGTSGDPCPRTQTREKTEADKLLEYRMLPKSIRN